MEKMEAVMQVPAITEGEKRVSFFPLFAVSSGQELNARTSSSLIAKEKTQVIV